MSATLTADILWWLTHRTRPNGPSEGQELMALIDTLQADTVPTHQRPHPAIHRPGRA